MQIHSNQHFII